MSIRVPQFGHFFSVSLTEVVVGQVEQNGPVQPAPTEVVVGQVDQGVTAKQVL